MKAEEPLSYVDDDIYWKNGWYNNPRDRRWMIQDRMCSSNYSLNMGKPGARYLAGIGIVAIVLVVLWMPIVFFQMDFVHPKLQIEETQVTVHVLQSMELHLAGEDIREIELLDALPEEEFRRTHGLSDSRQLWKIQRRRVRKGDVYIRRGETPVLKIKLPEYTVFINSEESGKVQEWYEELSS